VTYGKSIDQYRKAAVTSASPLQLVVMLYDGALRFMEAGKRAMELGDIFKQNDNLQRAQKIVAELTATLDLEKGGEIAQNLAALYSFVYDRLVQGNLGDNPSYIDQAIKVMSDLREGWSNLVDKDKAPQMLTVGEARHAA
jgi:flagellar protein FliS